MTYTYQISEVEIQHSLNCKENAKSLKGRRHANLPRSSWRLTKRRLLHAEFNFVCITLAVTVAIRIMMDWKAKRSNLRFESCLFHHCSAFDRIRNFEALVTYLVHASSARQALHKLLDYIIS